MKKIILIAIAALALMWLTPYIGEYFATQSKTGSPVTVTIPQGSTADSIADILKENNLIKHKIVFLLKVKMTQSNNKLNYGTYTMDDGMCIADIIKTLTTVSGDTATLVIPEGLSAENIAERAESIGICTQKDFLAALGDDYDFEFIAHIPSGKYKYKLQGYLFPDTYNFAKGTNAHTVVETLLANFDRRCKKVLGGYDDNTFALVTKASLIEKEAKLASEKPIIAGVIENRLRADMPLQIDAAIVYAITDGKYNADKVYYKDLEIDSPYNIYKNKGLPAGPICSPGLDSIKAAANPESHKYLYYHTDTEKNDGSHIFTETYDEHLQTQ